MNRIAIFFILIILLGATNLISYENHYSLSQGRHRLHRSQIDINIPGYRQTFARIRSIKQCIRQQQYINAQSQYIQQQRAHQQQQAVRVQPQAGELKSLESVQKKQAQAAARSSLSRQAECIIQELRPSFNAKNIHQPFVGAINLLSVAIDSCQRPDVKSLIVKMGLFDDMLTTSSLALHGCIDQFGSLCYHLFDEYSTHYHQRVKRIACAVVNRLGHPIEMVTDLVKGIANCGLFLVDAVICGIVHSEPADKKICDLVESIVDHIASLPEAEFDEFVGATIADAIATWGIGRIPAALKRFPSAVVSQKATQIFSTISDFSKNGMIRLCDFFERYLPVPKLNPAAERVPGSLMQSVDESLRVIGKGGKELIKVGTYAITPELTAVVEDLLNVTAHIESEIPLLEQLFSNSRKGFAECANKYIKIPFRHLLSVELDVNSLGIPRITGFHHDFNELIEKSGIVKFGEKVYDKFGCYKTKIAFNDVVKGKTFFPSSWSQEKVISKILEAYDNFIKNGAKDFRMTKNGNYRLFCSTMEEMNVEIIITKKGKIKSAYPLIERIL